MNNHPSAENNSRGRFVFFSIVRAVIGVSSVMYIFEQGAMAAEKCQAIGYALMELASVFGFLGLICWFFRSIHISVSVIIGLAGSLIVFRSCLVTSHEESAWLIDQAKTDTYNIAKYCASIFISESASYFSLFVKPLRRREFLALATMLLAVFLLSLWALASR
jgi:hypothetical protein